MFRWLAHIVDINILEYYRYMKKEKIDEKIKQLKNGFQKSAKLLKDTGKVFPASLLHNNPDLFKIMFYIEKHYETYDECVVPYSVFKNGSCEDAEVNILFTYKNHDYHCVYYNDNTIWLSVYKPEGENGNTTMYIARAKGTLAGFQKMMKHIKRMYHI